MRPFEEEVKDGRATRRRAVAARDGTDVGVERRGPRRRGAPGSFPFPIQIGIERWGKQTRGRRGSEVRRGGPLGGVDEVAATVRRWGRGRSTPIQSGGREE